MSCPAAEEFTRTGRLWLRSVLGADELSCLRDLANPGHRRAAGPGARLDGHSPLFQAVAQSSFTRHIRQIFPAMRPVRLVSFDKTTDGASGPNWGVPWHQDRVIAVKARHDLPGFHRWSLKQGIWHCEPPAELLGRMLFARIHLDPSTDRNGAMEIAPGSHREGRIHNRNAEAAAARYPSELTLAQAGDVLVLNMLTLHRSGPARDPSGRLTLRVDYAPCALPPPLDWAA